MARIAPLLPLCSEEGHTARADSRPETHASISCATLGKHRIWLSSCFTPFFADRLFFAAAIFLSADRRRRVCLQQKPMIDFETPVFMATAC